MSENELYRLQLEERELIVRLAIVRGRIATLDRATVQARALTGIGVAYDRERPR